MRNFVFINVANHSVSGKSSPGRRLHRCGNVVILKDDVKQGPELGDMVLAIRQRSHLEMGV